MPAGDPVLGSSRGDRQLLGNDLKDSNASSACPRLSDHPRTGAPRQGVTDVPTHEGPITWDICPEPKHPRSPSVKCFRLRGLCFVCTRPALPPNGSLYHLGVKPFGCRLSDGEDERTPGRSLRSPPVAREACLSRGLPRRAAGARRTPQTLLLRLPRDAKAGPPAGDAPRKLERIPASAKATGACDSILVMPTISRFLGLDMLANAT